MGGTRSLAYRLGGGRAVWGPSFERLRYLTGPDVAAGATRATGVACSAPSPLNACSTEIAGVAAWVGGRVTAPAIFARKARSPDRGERA